ncbi:hypothetical protein Sm713_45210 [Streptomyces sp. TS71-3]|nr:hypothetical protein Sm713_45210 [Streptomyces sp. TS71-3]
MFKQVTAVVVVPYTRAGSRAPLLRASDRDAPATAAGRVARAGYPSRSRARPPEPEACTCGSSRI